MLSICKTGGSIFRRFLSLNITSSVKIHNELEFEPVFEDDSPDYPCYDLLNIQVKGYDFTTVESFAKYVHNTAQLMNINVVQTWASPTENLQVTTLKSNSNAVNNCYMIKNYSRTVQCMDLGSIEAPILFNVLQSALPEGVSMTVKVHENEDKDICYIPDKELIALQEELETLKDGKK